MANGVNDPVGGLAAATQPMAQPVASWGTGGLGSYQLSDPSLAATPDWLKNRDPSLNRVDWGGNYDPVTGRLGVLPFFVGGSEAQDASYFQGGDTSDMAGYAGVLETGLPTYNISTEFGRPVDNYLKLNPASENPVRIINASKGEVTYEGASDPKGLVSALDQATAGGNKDIWSVQEKVGDQWVTTHKNEPIGNLVRDVALPAMLAVAGGAALGPLLGGAGTAGKAGLLGASKLAGAAGAGLGSAAGSFTGNVLAGKSFDDALKAAAITGVTAGVLKGVLPGGGVSGDAAAAKAAAAGKVGALTPVPGAGGMTPIPTNALTNLKSSLIPANAFSGLAPSATAPIVVTAAKNAVTPGLSQIVAPAVSTATGSLSTAAPQANQPQPVDEPGIVVSGSRIPQAGLDSILAGAVPSSLNVGTPTDTSLPGEELLAEASRIRPGRISDSLAAGTAGAVDFNLPGEELLAEASRIRPGRVSDSLAAATSALVPSQPAPVVDPGEIVVTGQKNKPAEIKSNLPVDLLAPVAGQFVVSDIVGGGKSLEQEQAEKDGKGGPGTLAKVTGGLAILDALSKLLGPKGGGTGGTGTGLDSLAPTFRAQLPTPRGQFAPQALTQRDRSDIDYARYGYGPARSFFNYVPETAAERAAFAAAAAPAPRVGVGSVFGPMSAGATPAGGSSNNIAAGVLPALAKAAGAPLPAVAFDSLNIDYNKFADSKMMQDLGGQFRNAVAQSTAPTGATTAVLSSGLDKLRAAMPGASDAEIEAFLATPEGQQALVMIFESMGAQPRAKGGKMGGEGRGRESFAVNGEGTGRSDEIPALLSDGEYVIDAETVALLGDGSSKAGAKRLNDFRVNIRKHKGRNLAKGKFSVNARRPERYLSGGQV